MGIHIKALESAAHQNVQLKTYLGRASKIVNSHGAFPVALNMFLAANYLVYISTNNVKPDVRDLNYFYPAIYYLFDERIFIRKIFWAIW